MLDRQDKIATLESYLRELEAALGPIPADEQEAAREWADRMLGDTDQPMSAQRNRSA